MTQQERNAVARLVERIRLLQTQISKPDVGDAEDGEVAGIFQLLWEWTSKPSYPLPSKHVVEQLAGLLRGCGSREYRYISREGVARIIRDAADNHKFGDGFFVILNKGYRGMTDTELYERGRWNYRETPLVQLLFNLHCNPREGGVR